MFLISLAFAFSTYSDDLEDHVVQSIVDLLHTQLAALVSLVCSNQDAGDISQPESAGDDVTTPTNESCDMDATLTTSQVEELLPPG